MIDGWDAGEWGDRRSCLAGGGTKKGTRGSRTAGSQLKLNCPPVNGLSAGTEMVTGTENVSPARIAPAGGLKLKTIWVAARTGCAADVIPRASSAISTRTINLRADIMNESPSVRMVNHQHGWLLRF
jgi:hypothetical protein